MNEWMLLGLVFVAALAVAYEVLSLVTRQLDEEARLKLGREDGENVSPLRRLVSPVQMTAYRISWACGLGVGLMVLLVLAGVSPWVYLPLAGVATAVG